MKVVIAPDKFKGSLSSFEVAEAIEEGILLAMPECEVIKLTIGDGGDGTAEAIVTSLGGKWKEVNSLNAMGEQITARFGIVDNKTAVLDVATASGIAQIAEARRNPLKASSAGTGILIREAINCGCRNFIIGVGGSATNDAAIGILSELGYKFIDANGEVLKPTGENLVHINDIDDSQRLSILNQCTFSLLCDVDATFYGPKGAAYLFAPQKGADVEMVNRLDVGLQNFASVLKTKYGKSVQNHNFSGAAGGIGGSMWAVLNASLSQGIYKMLNIIGFERAISGADLVVTGEGKMDKLTLLGKAAFGVCGEAAYHGIPTIALVGSVTNHDLINEYGFLSVFPIPSEPMPLSEAMQPEITFDNLKRMATQVFRLLLMK